MRRCLPFVIVLLCWWSQVAWAHKPSDSYLTLRLDGATVVGQWDIALRDLDFALGLDADQDGAITWGELRARHAEIAAYAFARLKLLADGDDCPLLAGEHLVDQHSDGGYAVLRFSAACPHVPAGLDADYRLFFDLDAQHKGLLNITLGAATESGVFAADAPRLHFDTGGGGSWRQFRDYVRNGVWHIWIGFDHILFLLSLLLPAVLLRRDGAWAGRERFPAALWEVARVVTAFTLAHSITLTLATLGVVALPSRWVESAIAASVVLAALNNVYPVIGERRWAMAFAFGLIHGFGFASVLGDLGLPRGALLLSLVGFNVGVEIGQLAIVAVFLPLAWWLRDAWVYRRLVLVAGSVAVAALALAWLAERAFDMKLIS